jgi:hypothetical protein
MYMGHVHGINITVIAAHENFQINKIMRSRYWCNANSQSRVYYIHTYISYCTWSSAIYMY